FPVDAQSGEDHVLRGGIVPLIAGRGLVMPLVLAGIDIDRDDAGDEQVVAPAGAARVAAPGPAVARADIDQTQVRIVSEGVPRIAPTAVFPPFAVPCRRGDLLGPGGETLSRIARNYPEAPFEFARFRVIGRGEAA